MPDRFTIQLDPRNLGRVSPRPSGPPQPPVDLPDTELSSAVLRDPDAPWRQYTLDGRPVPGPEHPPTVGGPGASHAGAALSALDALEGLTGGTTAKFAGSLVDHPGDLYAAGRAAWDEAKKAPERLMAPSGTQPVPNLGTELRARGTEVSPAMEGYLRLMGDPVNYLGGDPISGALELGASGVEGLAGLANRGLRAGHAAGLLEDASLGAMGRRLVRDESGELKLLPDRAGSVSGENVKVPEVLTPPTAPDAPRAMDALAGPDVAATARRLFPKLDKYSKPAPFVSGSTMLKRLATATDLSDETRTALTNLAGQVGTRRVSSDELQAMLRGETYKPERVVRRPSPIPEGQKQRVGAPLGVWNARQERGLRENYLRGMETGVAGRDWYDDSGKSILFHANDDPERATLVAGDLGITSPTTSVSANTGFGIKGYNQAAGGVPVRTGRYPTAMSQSIERLHAGGEESLGLKRDPFVQNLALGGGFRDPALPTRSVHDIWDGELQGFVNADGSPMRTGFGPAQHRFMDRQQDKLLATANQRALGGFTDWTDLNSQAAGWTGGKINAGDISPDEAAKSFANFFPEHYAQGSREVTPGPSTGHLPELLGPGMEEPRQLLHDIMLREGGIYDPHMRDQIAAGYGALTGRAFPGPGLYKGEINPGIQTQILTGSEQVPRSRWPLEGGLEGPPLHPGARQVDEGSRRLLDAAEATHGLLMGQDASAWSRVLPAGTGAPRGLWDITLPGGTITNEQMRALVMRYPGIGDMAIIPTPTGVRLGAMDPDTMKAITKQLGGKVKQAGAGLETGLASSYLPNNWQQQPVGQGYFDAIRRLGTEKFDRFAPQMADRIRKADALFRAETNGRFTMSQMLDEVRGATANEGFAGLERLAKKYGIPVALLTAGLQQLAAPESASKPAA